MPVLEGPVGGLIQKYHATWTRTISDRWVLSVVRDGYLIEFLTFPVFLGIRETKVGPKKLAVLLAEVQELLGKGAIETVPSHLEQAGYYCTFFVVPKKTGEDLRPILNLRPLNAHIRKQHFRMENLRTIKKAIQPGDWLVSIDLKDAYMHIPVHPAHRKYLRFNIAGQSYQFRVLPFGLASAPRVFTKTIAPIVAEARKWGIHIYPYLDDWLIRFIDPQILVQMTLRVLMLLAKHGWVVNLPKSSLDPKQDAVFIGGRFQTLDYKIYLPQDRADRLIDFVSQFRACHVRSARQFLVLLGMLNACIEMVPYARLMMRPVQLHLLYHWKPSSRDLAAQVPVNYLIRDHLAWWTNQENLFQGVSLHTEVVQETLFTDASDVGWGGFLVSGGQTQGKWTPGGQLDKAHINLKELEAVFRTCQYFEHRLRGKHVLVRCDNATVVSYLNKQGGTKSPSLCMKTWTFIHWLRTRDITLVAVHVRGVENSKADYLSRVFATALEWQLHTSVVSQLFLMWGRPNIDLFATSQNAQLPTFCARYPEPEAFQVDALQMDWSGISGYAFPPTSLIPLVLEKIRTQDCEVILIAPMWPRRSWYPQLLELLVEVPVSLPVRPDLLSQDRGRLWHPRPDAFNLTAWKLSGRALLQKAFLRRLSTRCSDQSGQVLDPLTPASGRFSQVGVRNGVSIPLRRL